MAEADDVPEKRVQVPTLEQVMEHAPANASGLLRFENASHDSFKPGDKIIVYGLRKLPDSPAFEGSPLAQPPTLAAASRLVEVGLRPHNKKTGQDCSGQLMRAVVRGQGRLALTDKSSPEAIRRALDMTKRQFRSALGFLLSKRRVLLAGGEIVALGRERRSELLALANENSGGHSPAEAFPLWPSRKRVSPAEAALTVPLNGISSGRARHLLGERRENRALASAQAAHILLDGSPASGGALLQMAGWRGRARESEAAEGAAWVAASRLRAGQRNAQIGRQAVAPATRGAGGDEGGLVTVDTDDESGEVVVSIAPDELPSADDVVGALAATRTERRVQLRDAHSGGRRRGNARGRLSVVVFADGEPENDPDEDLEPAQGMQRQRVESMQAAARVWEREPSSGSGSSVVRDSDIEDGTDLDDTSDDDASSDEEAGSEPAFPAPPLPQRPALSLLSDTEYAAVLDPLAPWARAPGGDRPLRSRATSARTRRALVAAAKAVPPPSTRQRGQWRRLRMLVPQPDLGGGVVPSDESDGSDMEHFKRMEGGILPGRSDAAVEEVEEEEEDQAWVRMVSDWLKLADETGRTEAGAGTATLRQLRRSARRAVERVELRRNTVASTQGLLRKRRQARHRVTALLGAASPAPEGANDRE